MTSPLRPADAVRFLPGADVAAFLIANSGLPGPRANLELADAFADRGDGALAKEFAASDDEYLALCGAIALGELVARGGPLVELLRSLASDERWRVREGVARGLQRVDLPRLRAIVAEWAVDPDPLVQRAAIAAICEPRLLKDAATAAAALDACRTTTRSAGRSRVLRQALGYCWSVAIAASPAAGLPDWAQLTASDDPDVRWIVRENSKKARLAKFL